MTDEIRVLHLITRFLRGGAETTTRHQLEALLEGEESYDVRLGYGAEYDEDHVQEVRDLGVETVRFRSIRHYNPFTAPFAVFAVAFHLWREDFDVLHTHSTEAGIIGRLAAWLARTPVVIHEVHGDPVAEDRNTVLNWTIERLERLAAHVSTCIIVKAEIIRDIYLERGVGKEEQYELIYHGVNLDRFRDVEPADVSSDEDVTLLFVGRIEDGKGLFDLVDAFEELESRHSVELLIVGDGSLIDELKREVDERDLEDVEFLGYREDVPEIMALSDVFVLPSYREGTPRVITEALASGLPVVSTDIAGIPEQVKDGKTGFLVEPGDVEALVDALDTLLLNTNLRDDMSKKTRKHVKKFELRNVQDKYREFYERLEAL